MADSELARSSLHSSRSETLSFENRPTMSLPHDTMVRPVHKHDFIDTEASEKVDKLLEDEDAYAIILTGVPGNGKTFLAEEKSAKLWHDNWSDHQSKIFRKFNCMSLETFCSDLALFYRDLNISASVLSKGKSPTWEIVQTLFEDMNEQFPFYHKLFVFDDVEDVEELLVVLDHIGRKIKQSKQKKSAKEGTDASTVTSASFKLFVTSQKKVARRPSYTFIGETRFVDVKGFSWKETKELFKYCDVSDETIRKLWTMLGYLPLALRICMKSLAADESGDGTEFVERYLSQIHTETKLLLAIPGRTDDDNRDSSALIAIKIAIDRLVADLPKPDLCYQLLKIVAVLNAKDISRDLLVACAETITPAVDEAGDIVRRISSRLIERSICTRRLENRLPLFSLHALVKQSLQLFIKPEEKEDILK